MKLFQRKDNSAEDNTFLTLDNVEDVIQQSRQEPVFIFKHSTTCPISSKAKKEVEKFLNNNDVPVYLVVVQVQRSLSNSIAEKFDVQHETPQALALRDGQAIKVYNHHQITNTNMQNTFEH